MAPEPIRAGEWRDVNKPGTGLLAGEKTKTLQEMGLARTRFAMQNQSPRLISLVHRLDGILNALECSPVNIWHIPKGFLPGRIYPVLEKGIRNIG